MNCERRHILTQGVPLRLAYISPFDLQKNVEREKNLRMRRSGTTMVLWLQQVRRQVCENGAGKQH